MKGGDAEEVEFLEITKNQEEVLETLSDNSIKLPERHPSNDEPKARDDFEKNRLKYKIKEKKKDKSESKSGNISKKTPKSEQQIKYDNK